MQTKRKYVQTKKALLKRKRTKPAVTLLAEPLNGDAAARRYDSARQCDFFCILLQFIVKTF